jgi:tyrosyl-tRNA synthetase
VTSLVHGADTALRVEQASRALFGAAELADLDADTLRDAVSELPSITVAREPVPVLDLLVATGLSNSRGAARRTLQEGGAYVNNVKVVPGEALDTVSVGVPDLLHDRWLLLRRGRRVLAAVEFVD